MPEPDQSAQRSGFVLPQGAAALAVKRLASVTAELSAAETLDDVVTAAVTHGSTAIGAAVTTLMLVRGDQMEMIAGTGLQPGTRESWDTFGLNDVNPASEAARTGRPILLRDGEETVRRYPVLRDWMLPGRSLVSLPFGGQPSRGVLGLTFDDHYLPGENELDLLLTFAGGCGQALSRIGSAEIAHQRTVELAFLAEASAELGRSLDYRTTLHNVAQLAVPWLAEWCAVDVLSAGRPVTMAVAHRDPSKVDWASDLLDRHPADPAAVAGAPQVMRTGRSELYPHVTEEMIDASVADEDRRRMMRQLNMRSVLTVPLLAGGGKVIGALSLIRTSAQRPFGPNELTVAEDLGLRAGLAIEHAQLYEASRDAAVQLQRAVLPGSLGDLARWEIATHYAPGGEAAGGEVEVGGDFYDAVELPDGRLAVVIGDVMGHGIAAAAAMAQARSAVRAYLTSDPDPETVLRKLDNMYRLLGTHQLVTLIYGVIDPQQESMSFVNAGHYPPLIIQPDERTRFAVTDPRMPLGAGVDDRTAAEVHFTPVDTLLLYTDGLIERRGEILDTGFARLADASTRLAADPLAPGLSELVRAVSDNVDDDVTAFAVRMRR